MATIVSVMDGQRETTRFADTGEVYARNLGYTQ